MEKNNICPICNIELTKSISILGPEVTYTRKINIGESKFNFCSSCGLGVNNSFKSFDFEKANYSNIDIDFVSNDDDDLLLQQFSNYFKEFLPQINKPESKICLEIGSGKKLSLINKISDKLNIVSYAVDPIFDKDKSHMNSITLLKDFSSLKSNIKPAIFIARNCLEYFSPLSIISIFKNKLYNKVLVLLELQSFDKKKWGNIFYFREYQYIYTKFALEKLFLKSGFKVQWLSSFSKYGDARTSYFAYISKNQSEYKKVFHTDINSLVNNLKRIKDHKKIYLWGAGGRGLNFIYNEGKGLVDIVIDSSEKRQGVYLKDYGQVIAPDLSIKNSIIILLNSNFISYIPSIIKKQNTIFMIS